MLLLYCLTRAMTSTFPVPISPLFFYRAGDVNVCAPNPPDKEKPLTRNVFA